MLRKFNIDAYSIIKVVILSSFRISWNKIFTRYIKMKRLELEKSWICIAQNEIIEIKIELNYEPSKNFFIREWRILYLMNFRLMHSTRVIDNVDERDVKGLFQFLLRISWKQMNCSRNTLILKPSPWAWKIQL